MQTRYIIYILVTALTISLIANEMLYLNVQSLQKDAGDYLKANNDMIQKASLISEGYNTTLTTPSP